MSTSPASASLTPVAQKFFTAVSQGDIDGLRAAIAPEIEWTVVGHTVAIAKTYRGYDEMFGELLGALATLFVPGSVKIEIIAQYEDLAQSTVVTHFHETAQGQASGKTFNNQVVTIMTIADGKIVKGLEFMDLYEFKQATEA
jgi:ketosteroid isomerase-like protein